MLSAGLFVIVGESCYNDDTDDCDDLEMFKMAGYVESFTVELKREVALKREVTLERKVTQDLKRGIIAFANSDEGTPYVAVDNAGG